MSQNDSLFQENHVLFYDSSFCFLLRVQLVYHGEQHVPSEEITGCTEVIADYSNFSATLHTLCTKASPSKNNVSLIAKLHLFCELLY